MPVCQMPFMITNEISEEEKTAWHNARLAEVKAGTYKGKEITPDFEPIEGWKPLKEYGPDPVLVIREAVYDNHRIGIYPGDYISATVLGTQYKFIIVKIGITPYNNSPVALMIADKPSTVEFNASDQEFITSLKGEEIPAGVDRWTYQYTRTAQYCAYFFKKMPNYLQDNILLSSVPCAYLNVDSKKYEVDFYKTRVFTPSVNEFCPECRNSIEGSFKKEFVPWPKIYKNSIDDFSRLNNCWLRTIRVSQRSNRIFEHSTAYTTDVENGGKVLYALSRSNKKRTLLCFCIG